MTAGKFIRFQTPSQMEPESLEAIFVQREPLAERLVDKIVESAKTASKHHALLVGPRGIGKTHLVSLVYNRVYNRVLAQEQARGRLAIAWLREDAYSVASYAHLLLAILKALREAENGFDEDMALDQLYGAEEGLREARAEEMLLTAAGERTLLLITENLEDTFEAIGSEGQAKLRALIQNHPRFTILATTQSLFGGVQLRTSPFYGFFEIHHLDRFSFEKALEMLRKIAEFKGDSGLANLLRTPTGRARVRAIDHLAAGSPRIYVILSEFLRAESIEELVEPVLKMIENLTPYYQSRMQLISPQQRALVEYLCEREAAVTVGEISRGVLLTSQTASSQLRKLQDLGYVRRHPEGRKSYYELQEPLMRIALAAKKQRGKPFRLFVEFLRCWFTESELSVRAKAGGAFPLDSEYAGAALELLRSAGVDPRLEASARDYRHLTESQDYTRALAAAEEVVELRGAPRDWMAKGQTEIEIGQFEEALASYEQALELDAGDATAWHNQGAALAALGRYEEAVVSFDKALELNAEDGPAWRKRGLTLAKLGRYEEALASFEKTVELNAEDAEAWNNQGAALARLGRYEEALASFEKTVELNAEDAAAWYNQGIALRNLGRYEEALASFEKALDLNAEDSAAWSEQGVALGNLGRHEEELASYEKALDLNAEDTVAWRNRGVVLASLGRHEEELASYEKALELNAKNAEAWNNQGVALAHLGRYEEALAAFEKAVELDAEDGVAWHNRGAVLGDLGRHEEALASSEKVVELNAEHGEAWRNRGIALGNLGRHEEALTSYEKAVELNAEDGEAWRECGVALTVLGRYEEALAPFEKALELNAEDAAAWNNQGVALENLGRHEESLASYEKAVELNDEDGAGWRNRGVALGNLGRHEEALASYEKAVELNAEDAMAWRNRGVALGNLGRHEEALAFYEKAVELNVEDAMAWRGRGFALGNLGRHEEALASFEKAVEVNAGDAAAWSDRGVSLARLGRYEGALASYEKAVELNAEGGAAWHNRGLALGHLGRYEEALVSLNKAISLEPEHLGPAILHSQLRVRLGSISAAEKQLRSLSDRHPPDAVAVQLVYTILTLRFPEFGEEARRQWVRICKDAFAEREEYHTALRLLEAATDYLNSGDPAALFALPAEERSIVAPLVGWAHDEADESSV